MFLDQYFHMCKPVFSNQLMIEYIYVCVCVCVCVYVFTLDQDELKAAFSRVDSKLAHYALLMNGFFGVRVMTFSQLAHH